MSKIAIIASGGKQYKVEAGDVIKVEKLEAEDKAKVNFETLLVATKDTKEFNLGQPSLGKKVSGEVVEQGRNKKVKVVKYKNKIRYKRTLGHKQAFTAVKITSIA